MRASKQNNITSTEPSNILIKDLGWINSIEFGLKMGHSTGLDDLLCTAVKLFIYSYHIIDQETPLPMHDSIHVHIFQPTIKPDLIIKSNQK